MSRCSWIWFVCWSVLGVGVSGAALADAGVPVVSLHGVRFELPADLKPVPAAAASQRNLSKAFIDGRGVQVLLLEPAPPDPTKAAQKLAFSVEDYARGFANSVQDKLGQGTLTDIEPLAHDPERGAVRARFTFNGPSPVASFLALPDEHPAWAPLRRPNVDTRQVRCLFRALLGEATTATEPELRAHVGAAASRCGRSTAEVETFAGALPASLFAPQRASLETISVFTRSAAVHMLVMAPEAAQAAAEFSTQLIWERFTVGAGTRPEVSISAVLRGTGMFDTGHLLGVAMGAALAVFVFGGLLGLLLARLSQLTAERAVLGVLVGIAALMLLGMVAGQLSWPAGVQFVAFTATGVLNRRRLTQWVAERADTDDDGGTGAPPKGPLACTQGLSTLEYGLLFVVVAAGGLLLWANLSERTAEHVQTSTAEMMAAMDGAMTRGRTGTASPPGIQGSSPSGFHSSDAPMPSDGQQHSHNAATAPPSGGQAHPAAATASTSHATGGVPLTAQTPLTTSYGAGETEESWWQSTKDYVRDTPPAQFIAGLVAGGIDGTTILTGFVESPEGSGTLFQVGRVAGEFGMGVLQMYAGPAIITAGLGLMGKGMLVTAGSGGLAVPIGGAEILAGAGVATLGGAMWLNGAYHVAQAGDRAWNLMTGGADSAPTPKHGGGGGTGSGSGSSGGSGKGPGTPGDGSGGPTGGKPPTPGNTEPGTGFVRFRADIADHLARRDPTVPRKNGIGGAHNVDEFNKHAADLKIVSRTDHPSVPGIQRIEYQIPALDQTGAPTGAFKAKVFEKTVYDPRVISDTDFYQLGRQAAAEAQAGGRLTREWVGTAPNGLRFRGYLDDTGAVRSFFPDF